MIYRLPSTESSQITNSTPQSTQTYEELAMRKQEASVKPYDGLGKTSAIVPIL